MHLGTRWHHGHSQIETKYTANLAVSKMVECNNTNLFYYYTLVWNHLSLFLQNLAPLHFQQNRSFKCRKTGRSKVSCANLCFPVAFDPDSTPNPLALSVLSDICANPFNTIRNLQKQFTGPKTCENEPRPCPSKFMISPQGTILNQLWPTNLSAFQAQVLFNIMFAKLNNNK